MAAYSQLLLIVGKIFFATLPNYLTVSVSLRGAEAVTHAKSRKAASCDYRALRDLALVDLLFATGLRVGEASTLDVRDYFTREAVFRVQGKGG